MVDVIDQTTIIEVEPQEIVIETSETILISGGGGGSGEANVGQNIGTGLGIYEGKNFVTLRFRSLIGSPEILITQNAEDLTFSVPDHAIDLLKIQEIDSQRLLGRDTAGLGQVEILDGATVRSVIDFDNSVSNNVDVVINSAKVSADGPVTTHSDVTDAGSGEIITAQERAEIIINSTKVSADGSVGTHSDVDITAPAPNADPTLRILADVNTDGSFTVVDWSPPTAAGGEVNDGDNLGTGSQVYQGKTGVTLNFRSFVDTPEIVITQNADDLTFAIATSAIGFDKITDIDENEILGRISASTGIIERLSATDVRFIINVENGATANDTDANLRDRTTHTGTQLSSTISDFQTSVSVNTDVVANTAKVSADGSVTTHVDVTDSGSGAIITAAERSAISDRTQHTGDSIYNDEAIRLQFAGVQRGLISAGLVEDLIFVAYVPPGDIFDETDGAVALGPSQTTLYGTSAVIHNLKGDDFRNLQIDPNGVIYAADLPESGWEVNDTDTGSYDLGTGTGAGTWIRLTGLELQIPQAIVPGERIDYSYALYVVNKTENRTGSLEIRFTIDSGIPAEPTIVDDTRVIGAGFEGYVSSNFTTSNVTANANDFVRVWTRINNGSHGQFGLDLVGTPNFHELFVAKAAGGGSGEANVTSNQGGGTELALPKSGVELPFRTLTSVDSSIVLNQGADTVDLALAPGTVSTLDSYSGMVEVVQDKPYTVDQSTVRGYTITSFSGETSGGSCLLTVQIDGFNVTGLTSITMITTGQTYTATANNVVNAGQKVRFIVSGNSSAVDLGFTLAIDYS